MRSERLSRSVNRWMCLQTSNRLQILRNRNIDYKKNMYSKIKLRIAFCNSYTEYQKNIYTLAIYCQYLSMDVKPGW